MDANYKNTVLEVVSKAGSGDPATREAVEEQLDKVLPQAGPLPAALLEIAVNSGIDAAQRMTAAVLLNNEVKYRWCENEGLRAFKKLSNYWYPAEVKTLIKQSFLDGMLMAGDRKILKLLGNTLREILIRELERNHETKTTVDHWAGIEDEILARMTTDPNPGKMYAMMVAYHARVKSLQYSLNEERSHVNESAGKIYPTLLAMAQNTVTKDDEASMMLNALLAKVFYRTIRTDIVTYLRQPDVSNQWMEVIFGLARHALVKVKAMAEAGADAAEVEQSLPQKVFKWTMRSLNRYVFRYGNPQMESEQFQAFATAWQQAHFRGLWEMSYEVFVHFKELKLPRGVVCLVLKNMNYMQYNPFFGNELVPVIKTMLTSSIINAIEFTQEDLDLFIDNPVEYFRRNSDESFKYTLKKYALMFLSDSLEKVDKNREHNLLEFMLEFVKGQLDNPETPIVRKEACLTIARRMDKVIFAAYAEKGYDYFLSKASEMLNSEHGFARMSALKLISVMMYPQFGDNEALKFMAPKVVALFSDAHLPVRSCAGMALKRLLFVPILKQEFEPQLKDILQAYLKLVSEFESDELLEVFREIFTIYRDSIATHAIELINSLVELFYTLVAKEKKAHENEQDDECMESGSAGLSCLLGIEELFRAPLSVEVADATFNSMLRLLETLLVDPDGFEYGNEICMVLNGYLFLFEKAGSLPEPMWALFSLLTHTVGGLPDKKAVQLPGNTVPALAKIFTEMNADDEGSELFLNVVGIFKNFIRVGAAQLTTARGITGAPVIDSLMKALRTVIEKHILSKFMCQEIAFSLMVSGYLISHVGPAALGGYFQQILDMHIEVVMQNKAEEKASSFVNCLIYTLGLAMNVDHVATLEYLQGKNLLGDILQKWVSSHRASVIYPVRKASFLGLMAFFKLSNEQLALLPVKPTEIYAVLMKDLKKLAYEQTMLADEVEGGAGDDLADMVNLDNFDLDDMIKKTHAEIDQVKDGLEDGDEGPGEFDFEAHNVLAEIEEMRSKDRLDELNEVLLFAALLEKMQAQNAELFGALQGVTTEAMTAEFRQAVEDVKKLAPKQQ